MAGPCWPWMARECCCSWPRGGNGVPATGEERKRTEEEKGEIKREKKGGREELARRTKAHENGHADLGVTYRSVRAVPCQTEQIW